MKQTEKHGKKNQIGALGESIAVNYLKSKDFLILEQNYLKKWGEIDIVAQKMNRVHFIEVKTVSYETKKLHSMAVFHGTWRPEENVHYKKLQRMHKTIESWLAGSQLDLEWQIDIIAIRCVPREKYATVKYIENIIIS